MYFYNSNCSNCRKFGFSSISMDLLSSISLDEDPASSAISLYTCTVSY